MVAILVPKAGRTLDEAALKVFLEPRLARYKIPRVFEIRDALPRTASGKLMKHLLRRSAQQ